MPCVKNNHVFDRVLIIMFENMYRSYVMKNEYMRSLAQQGIDMANYFGVMHPSQTNYIASIAGELCNVSNDARPSPPLKQQTIVDLLEAKGLEWRAYMDGYPKVENEWKTGLVPRDSFPYVIKHNPFSSFENILNNEARWNKIVDQNQFFCDVASGNLPEYAWFTPNMWHDGHYSVGTTIDPTERAPALVDQQATWLRYFFDMLKFPGSDTLLPPRTLVVVTYDESDFESKVDVGEKYTYDGPNQIYTVLLDTGEDGAMRPMFRERVEHDGYNHYSLIRTIEENFQLGSLEKNDRYANFFQFLWGHEFVWREADPIPVDDIDVERVLAITEFNGTRFLAHRVAESKLYLRHYHQGTWKKSEALDRVVAYQAAFAQVNEELILLYMTPGGIEQMQLDAKGRWVNHGEHVVTGEVKRFAVTDFDAGNRLMLVWSDVEGNLQSLVYSHNKWAAEIVAVGGENTPGFRTTGQFCLGQCGASLYCIYEAEHRQSLMMVGYNTVTFNVVNVSEGKYAGPYDDTTCDQWSPSAFPVSEYSHAPSPVTPGEEEPISELFRGCGPLACTSLDGVLHLVHAHPDRSDLVTETFSVAGMLTPKLPVSYASGDQTTTSNGYGTLAEAGWSAQQVLCQVKLAPEGCLAMCQINDGVWLVHVGADGQLQTFEGRYLEKNSQVEHRHNSQVAKPLRSVS